MAYHLIQFQHGMWMPEFIQCFGTEGACVEALHRARWPAGFVCPQCGSSAHRIVANVSRRRFQGNACHVLTSMTAGTLFASTKLPPTTWFLAIYLLILAKTGLLALALRRQFDVSYPTGWLMHHKAMKEIADREAAHRLYGAVEAYLGGERAGGKPGRGSENKGPIVAAISLRNTGRPLYVEVTQVPGFTSDAILKWTRSNLAPRTALLSYGMSGFAASTDAHCTHSAEIVGKRKPRDLPQFKRVKTVLGNLKTMLSGAYKSCGYSKHADHCLGAFAYRSNRRFDLADLVVRLVVDVCRSKATPLRAIRQAHVYF